MYQPPNVIIEILGLDDIKIGFILLREKYCDTTINCNMVFINPCYIARIDCSVRVSRSFAMILDLQVLKFLPPVVATT